MGLRSCRRQAGVVAMGALLAVLPLAAAAEGGAAAFADENIEKAAIARINGQHFANAHVKVASFHRRLLLTGEVPSEAVRAEVQKTVSGIENVQGIDDELVVGPISGISTRTRDSWITSDVQFRLRKGGFGRDAVKVATENGTVYLMGTLTRKDGAAAAEIASATDRVERVVLVFQYLD